MKQLPFGRRGLWGPSVEAFYRRGLLEPLVAEQSIADSAAGPRPGSMVSGQGVAGHFAGVPIEYSNIDTSRWTYRLPGPADMMMGCATEQIERVLAKRALELGVEIRRGQAVEGLEASDEQVSVRTGEHRLSALWLVGCDGL